MGPVARRLRDIFAVLKGRDFRFFFIGQATSWIGTGMLPVALSFVVISRGGGASAVGVVLGAETGGFVLFLLVGGVIADRLSRRAIMVTCDIVRAVAQLGLGVALLLNHPGLPVICAVELVVGAATAFFAPSVTGLMPQLASPDHLQQANSLNAATMWAGNLLGPAVAGVIVLASNSGWAIVADGGTYVASTICMSRLRVRRVRSDRSTAFLQELCLGWRDFRSRTWLWVIVGQFSFIHLLVVGPFLVLGAVQAHLRYGGARAWSTILVAQGVGSLLGALTMFRIHPRRPLVVGELACLGCAAPLVAIALNAPLVAVAGGALALGAGFGILGPLWDTTMQRQIPPELLSRVSAYDIFGSVALLPVGAIIAGPLASAIGLRPTLLVGACFVVVSCIGSIAVRDIHTLVGPATPTLRARLVDVDEAEVR